MMYYAMLSVAVVLFASQFLFNQKFQEECGNDLKASVLFSLLSSVGGFLVLFIINGFKIEFSAFSFLMGIVYSLIGILYNYVSIKAFEKVNLSAYSVFAMLGGMLIPSVYGIAFRNEELTLFKILCYAFTVAAIFITIDFKEKKRGTVYYILVFLLNGLTGVVSVIHQSNTVYHISDSFSFLMQARISSVLICLPFGLKNLKALKKAVSKNSFVYSFGFSVFCSIGNLLVLIALKHLPASVQFPIITGGVMLVSLVISILRKEKVSEKNIFATVIAFVSTLLLAI